MNNNIFYLPISEETSNYLQRLGIEVDSRLEIIDRLFTNHVNDTDASVLSSVPFKEYHKQFDDINAEYIIAKENFGKEIRPLVEEKVGKKDIDFDWMIEDFSTNQVKITIK